MVAQVHKVDAVCLYGIILVSVYVYGPYGLCILGPSWPVYRYYISHPFTVGGIHKNYFLLLVELIGASQ